MWTLKDKEKYMVATFYHHLYCYHTSNASIRDQGGTVLGAVQM